jgi:hypothetical protein
VFILDLFTRDRRANPMRKNTANTRTLPRIFPVMEFTRPNRNVPDTIASLERIS